jgi:hypothetical protein
MAIALTGVAAVWLAGAVWSFREQENLAGARGFVIPMLLPLTIDGLALSLAAVAWAASLDGRAAINARLGTAIAIAASAASNGWWAHARSARSDTVWIAVCVPCAAFLAFEVLLGELRRQIAKARGQAQIVPIPMPRPIRILLDPWREPLAWRRLVLEITDPRSESWESRHARSARTQNTRDVAEPGTSVVSRGGIAAAATAGEREPWRSPTGHVGTSTTTTAPTSSSRDVTPGHVRRAVPGPAASTAGRTEQWSDAPTAGSQSTSTTSWDSSAGTTVARSSASGRAHSEPDVSDLFLAGQRAAQLIASRNESLTWKRLATELRGMGHAISTDKARALLRRIKEAA